MRKIYKLLSALSLLGGLLYMSSCEERIELDYVKYSPDTPAKFSYSDKTFYPMKTTLVSDTPVFSVEGLYTLIIDSVHSTDVADYIKSNFKIDDASGVITYENKTGSINPGDYFLDVSIHSVNSVVEMAQAYNFTVLDVPVSITANPYEVTTGALEQGTISTVTYTDESPEQNLVVESYEISPFVKGYSINAGGEIIKSTNATPNSTDTISVQVNTNLGSKTFSNVMVVHVGPPPTILYTKASDSDTLKNVIIAPTSSYSTQAPQLSGMNPDGGWTILMADTVPQAVKDVVTVSADGVISFNGSPDVPDGIYTVGVRVTNSSGVSFDFNDLFTFSVLTKWGEVIFADGDFSDPAKINYYRDSNADAGYAAGAVGGVSGAKGYHGNGQLFISGIIVTLNKPADWNGVNMLVSFDERNGWGSAQEVVYSETVRELQFSYDNATWSSVMSNDNPAWPTTGSGGVIAVKDQPVENVDINQPTIFFRWNYDNTGSALTKSVWLLANIKFKYTVAFETIEE